VVKKAFTSIVVFIIALTLLSPYTYAISQHDTYQWPPWSGGEPYPWLDYLKNLPHETGVKLRVITRHEETIIDAAKQAFLNSPVAKELGITDIIPIYAGPELWQDYIQRSLNSGQPIDIAWGGGPTLFDYIDNLGLIEPLNNNTHPEYNAILYEMTKIPERIAGAATYKVGDDGYVHWIGAAISSFGFTVNHDRLNQYGLPMPRKWIDLTKPEYAKYLPTELVGIADPTQSTSNTRMYEIILQAYGWDEGWRVLTLMAANSKIFSGSSDVRDAAIRGDIAVGITIDFYGYTAMNQNPACEYVIPENESIVNADPIAVLKNTRYPVQAAAFVAWVLSEYGGQQVWLNTNINRLPINNRVFDTDAGRQRQDLKQAYDVAASSGIIMFNETLAGLTEKAMQFYFKATLINAHDDLQNTWRNIAKAYLESRIDENTFKYLVRKLTDPLEFKDPVTGNTVTFTLEYAIMINNRIATDASIYQALMSEWEDGARSKYLDVDALLQSILSGETSVPQETSPSTSSPITQTPGTSANITTSAPQETSTTSPSSQPTTSTQPSEDYTGIIIVVVVLILIVLLLSVFYMRK